MITIDVVGFLTSEIPRWQHYLAEITFGTLMYIGGRRRWFT